MVERTPTQRAIEARGGLIKTAELHRLGLSDAQIAEAVRFDEIRRVRQAWFSTPWLGLGHAQAARVGGQLACVSAAGPLGMWDPKSEGLHVAVDRHARALRDPSSFRALLSDASTVVHWSGRDPHGSRVSVSPEGCITQIAECASPEVALAVAESALQRGVISERDWRRYVDTMPRRAGALLSGASPRSESGTESFFVFRMARLGVVVRQQVQLDESTRVDGLIGERLVTEMDSASYHSDPEPDRQRDARLGALGFRVLRFTYRQVMTDWPSVEAAVLAAIARGDHRAPGPGAAGQR